MLTSLETIQSRAIVCLSNSLWAIDPSVQLDVQMVWDCLISLLARQRTTASADSATSGQIQVAVGSAMWTLLSLENQTESGLAKKVSVDTSLEQYQLIIEASQGCVFEARSRFIAVAGLLCLQSGNCTPWFHGLWFSLVRPILRLLESSDPAPASSMQTQEHLERKEWQLILELVSESLNVVFDCFGQDERNDMTDGSTIDGLIHQWQILGELSIP